MRAAAERHTVDGRNVRSEAVVCWTIMTNCSLPYVFVVALVSLSACKGDSLGGVSGDGGPDSVGSDDASVDSEAVQVDGATACRAPSPNYGPTSVFEVLPYNTPRAPTTCPVACGDSAWPGNGVSYPPIDIMLPYGSCTPGTPSCSTTGSIPCACEPGGPSDTFNCSCEGGTWICRIRDQGASLCMPCSDASVSQIDQTPVVNGPQDADEGNQ